MEQLLIRLGSSEADTVHWLVWSSSEQEIIASGELAGAEQLSTLKERAGQRPVITLVPTSDIVLKWVTLPARAGRKVINAIPFMLEDELATDITDQFFAHGPKKGEQQAVAIVARDKLDAWQSWLSDAGLFCDTIIPDVLAVPAPEEGLAILELGQSIIVRQGLFDGFQGEREWTLPLLAHQLRQSETPVQVTNHSALPLNELTNVELLAPPLEMPMNVLAQEAMRANFNLLQGEYKIKRKRTGQAGQWRIAAVLAIMALTTSLLDKTVTLYQLKSQNADLKAQINQTVKQGFPNIGAYRDVRRKLNAELAKLEQGGSNASMLAMIDQLSLAFSQSNVKPQTLRFDAKRTEIRMQAVASNFDALENFKRQAEAAGFTVEQGAINNKNNQFIGNIIIRSAS